MKKVLVVLSILLSGFYGISQEISPYCKIAEMDGEISAISAQVKDALTGNGFSVIGEYAPAKSKDLFVICFTNNQIKDLCVQYDDRGALAGILKVGLVKKEGKTTVSILTGKEEIELVSDSKFVKAIIKKSPIGTFVIAVNISKTETVKPELKLGKKYVDLGGRKTALSVSRSRAGCKTKRI